MLIFAQEIWQPWKPIIPAQMPVGFPPDRLDHLYAYENDFGRQVTERETRMRGLAAVQGQRVDYLILQ
jgi:hypothetical protein